MGGRVCVIGAGVAGLVTAKVLRDDGFEVLVFERLPTIGGVWHHRAPILACARTARARRMPFPIFHIRLPPTNFRLPSRFASTSRRTSNISGCGRCSG
jgi:cation diffusion facilitator CzcD-associated flavoprotein CzcO